MKVVLSAGARLRLREHSRRSQADVRSATAHLWHVMRYYAHYGHRDFILCLGYRATPSRFFSATASRLQHFVLSDGGRGRAARSDIETADHFADTGLDTTIGERLRRVRTAWPARRSSWPTTGRRDRRPARSPRRAFRADRATAPSSRAPSYVPRVSADTTARSQPRDSPRPTCGSTAGVPLPGGSSTPSTPARTYGRPIRRLGRRRASRRVPYDGIWVSSTPSRTSRSCNARGPGKGALAVWRNGSAARVSCGPVPPALGLPGDRQRRGQPPATSARRGRRAAAR